MIEPQLAQIDTKAERALQVCKINADENFLLATRYRLTTIPTLLLFHGGEVIHRIDQFSSRDDLKHQLNQMLSQVI